MEKFSSKLNSLIEYVVNGFYITLIYMTDYKAFNVSLSENQKSKLAKAIMSKSPITLRLSSDELSGSDNIFLTKTQINKIKKSKTLNKGVDIKISKTQISRIKSMVQSGMGLQNRPSNPPQVKAKDKVCEIDLSIYTIMHSTDLLLSSEVGKIKRAWESKKKKNSEKKSDKTTNSNNRNVTVKFINKPLSNIDLMRWCEFLSINITGIYSRDEHMPEIHSPCIINLDDFDSAGTHWTCCVRGENDETLWYFDSFGMHYPQEFEIRAKETVSRIFCSIVLIIKT